MSNKKYHTVEQICENTELNLDNYQTLILDTCCICKGEILSKNNLVFCRYCRTTFHRKHLISWLKIKNKCPMCHISFTPSEVHFYLNITHFEKIQKKQETIINRCSHCDYHWNPEQHGKQIWCPKCEHTQCPHCKSTFHFLHLLNWLHTKQSCPSCKKHLRSHELIAGIKLSKNEMESLPINKEKENLNSKNTRKNQYEHFCPKCKCKWVDQYEKSLLCPVCSFDIIRIR